MKEEKVLQYIADMAVQATEERLALEDRVTKRFDGIDKRFAIVDQRFDGIDKRFAIVDQRFDGIDKRLDGVDKRLDGLDRRIDSLAADLRGEMQSMRIDNLTLHAEVIGYLKRAEQDRLHTSEHLRRHDEQIEFLMERVR